MHIEPEQSNVLESRRNFCNGECLVKRYPELHTLLTRARVWVRRVDQDFGIYAQCHRSDDAEALSHIVEYVQLLLGFHIDKEHFGTKGFFHLALGLSDAAEHDVASRIACL